MLYSVLVCRTSVQYNTRVPRVRRGCRFALAGIGINRVKTAIVDEDTPMTTSLGAGLRFTFDVSASCGRIF